MQILKSAVKAKLPAGTSITIDDTVDGDFIPDMEKLLQAFLDAQVEQNATAPEGEDVISLRKQEGAQTEITDPDTGTPLSVVPTFWTFTLYAVKTISRHIPMLQ
ncbi:hypothetical protein NG799_02290 [Laspinema sp. D1]|uniref:Uncharacterized protein n=1 Tax=Laspinema palackyanum D2a TaxID=2953684 RepID=A0ABT2ML00_9CYAN|nr:hypothetical protein [Laspinema sp. D2a]